MNNDEKKERTSALRKLLPVCPVTVQCAKQYCMVIQKRN